MHTISVGFIDLLRQAQQYIKFCDRGNIMDHVFVQT